MTDRPFTVIDCEQRSERWFAARAGRITGTCAHDLMGAPEKPAAPGTKPRKKKTEERAGRRDLRAQKVVERLTGLSADDDFTRPAWMQRGIDEEAAACHAYEAATGRILRHTGFLSHNTLRIGCSLDGHVGDFEGIIEAKAPKMATHFRYLMAGTLPADYYWQVVHNLFVSGAAWCDFLSFDARFPPELQRFIVRVERKDVPLEAYEKALRAFLTEVERDYQACRTMMSTRQVLAEVLA